MNIFFLPVVVPIYYVKSPFGVIIIIICCTNIIVSSTDAPAII